VSKALATIFGAAILCVPDTPRDDHDLDRVEGGLYTRRAPRLTVLMVLALQNKRRAQKYRLYRLCCETPIDRHSVAAQQGGSRHGG